MLRHFQDILEVGCQATARNGALYRDELRGRTLSWTDTGSGNLHRLTRDFVMPCAS